MSAIAAGRRPARSFGNSGPGRRVGGFFQRWSLPAFTGLALLYLLIPIIVIVAFSFNDPPGRFNFVWGRFSLGAWLNPLGRPRLADALSTSLYVAFVSTIVATMLGTLIALALTRYQFRGRAATSLFIFIPMATPEIVLGASLLTLFVGTASEPWKTLTGGALFPLGVQTILIAQARTQETILAQQQAGSVAAAAVTQRATTFQKKGSQLPNISDFQ